MLLTFFGSIMAISAQFQSNMMLPLLLLDKENDNEMNNMALMLMMAQNGQHGGNVAENQMNMMLPLILLSKSDSSSKSSNSDLMMLMLMQQPNAVQTPSMLLPYILLKDKDTNATNTDMTSLFIATSMMQRSCDVDTTNGLQSLMPLLLLEQDSEDDKLMSLLMMQMMSPGSNAVSLDMMMPFILLMDKESNNTSNLLTMTLLSSSMGGMTSSQGYNTNFNILLPLALADCNSDNKECNDQRSKMLVLLMAMQSSAPGSPINTQQLLPLLLMKDDANNEQLIIFMTMLSQQPSCLPKREQVIIKNPLPEPVVETLYREFRVDTKTGEKTLIRTSARPFNNK